MWQRAVVAFAGALLFGAASGARAQDAAEIAAVLAANDITVGTGIAAGVVPDEVCSACHIEQARSYSEMGMAQSFYRPDTAPVIEDFANPRYFQAATQRYYEMTLRDGDYWFRRYRLAADGTDFDDWSVKVDWIMGSGHHSRIYMYQTTDGAIFQLPLAWYSQPGKWAMAPGFEFDPHPGIGRQVHYRCMTCHNAVPDLPKGANAAGMPSLYPVDMPQGIGCQRCHGPGARHAGLALAGSKDYGAIIGSIVNPGDLPRSAQDSLCQSCHMQPAVAVPASLRLGRRVYDFHPGQEIEDFLVQLDITDAHRTREQRFDINHHAYRLEQSPCFLQSGGALGCLSCHDPHRKVPPEQRAGHYRAVCLECHATDAAGLPELQVGTHPDIAPDADCTICHMPQRRTQDVIEVWMTDHRITRDPGPGDLLRPIAKLPADVTEVHLADPHQDVSEDEAWVYKMMGVMAYTNYSSKEAKEVLRTVLERGEYPDPAPWLMLAKAFQRAKDYPSAAKYARRALEYAPGNPDARDILAGAMFKAGNPSGGVSIMQDAVRDFDGNVDHHINLAALYLQTGNLDGADFEALRSIALQRTAWRGWDVLGDVALARGNVDAAAEAYTKVLEIVPGYDKTRKKLVSALETLGQSAAADRHRAALPE